jgi:acetyl esterase
MTPKLGDKAQHYYDTHIKGLASASPVADIAAANIDIIALRASTAAHFGKLLEGITLPSDIIIEQRNIKINKHPVKLRIYTPRLDLESPLPVIVFHPGGGLALDMQADHDLACAEMSKASEAKVISIQPPLSPELKHPEILDIAYAATLYVYNCAAEFNINSKHFIVGGFSMGGNLAALIVNRARSDRSLAISGQILISAQTDCSLSARRDERYNIGADLDYMAPISMQEMFINLSVPTAEIDLKDPRISPYYDDLHGLPPTILISGGCDALMPDMRAYAAKLCDSGIPHGEVIIPGQIHNTTLLYPLLGDGPHPAMIAGIAAKALIIPPEHGNLATLCRDLVSAKPASSSGNSNTASC